jgi:hypothetical protein
MLRRLLDRLGSRLNLSPATHQKSSQPSLEQLEQRLVPTIPRPDHVVIVMEENHAYNEIIGSSSAPYINNLAGQGALMTNDFAIEHPSEPNYLDIFSGSNQGITYDGYDNPGAFPGPDLAGEAIGAGLTFGAYIEDYPGNYDHDHAPWDLFSDVPSSTEKDYASNWPTDYTTLPTISIVTPNLNDDMHDGTIQQGDTWLQNNIDSYAQWAKTHNSLLIVQWDEDDGTQNNQVPCILVGQMVNPGTYGESINHFNVLRTIEDMYGLPYAGQSASVNPISDIWTSSPPPAASSFQVNGFPSPTTAGQSGSFTVTALDSSGHVATGYTGTVHFTSSDTQAVLPANYTFTTADQGVHTFTATLDTAGTQSLTVTDTTSGGVTGSQSGITVNSAAANSLVLSGFSSPTTAGVAHNFTVTARDAYGNTASGYTGTIHFTSSDGQASLPADYTFTGGDAGSHSFSATLKTAGSESLTATDTGSGMSGSQTGITVRAGAAAVLTVTAPANVTAGAAFSFTVQAQDAYGNTATGYRGTIHFTSSDTQAGLPANYTFTSTNGGIRTFNATLQTAGSQTITATDTAHSSITGSATVAVASANGQSLGFSAGSYTAHESNGSATITVVRTGGSSGTVTVQFATSNGSAAAGAEYTAASGVLTFADGVSSQTFTVTFLPNGIVEGNETVTLRLSNPGGGAALATPSAATLTIKDSDGTQQQRFVAQLYLDLLHRQVDPLGLAAWTSSLVHGATRGQVVMAIESSVEYRSDLVTALYVQYLHRGPEAAGLQAFVGFLASGGTLEQVAAMITGSGEYFVNRGGGTNDGFLTALYADALHRAVDSAGRSIFDRALAQGATRQQVAQAIFASNEYRQDLVRSFYWLYLHRPADRGGLNAFAGALGQGATDQAVIAAILASKEYYTLAQ